MAGRAWEDQWSIPLPRSAVTSTVSTGQTWLVWKGREPIATITLTTISTTAWRTTTLT
jgi:hypothetical protein